MGRSNAYWKSNRYMAEAEEPEPTAPLRDLPPALASRFQAVRDGLLQISGAAEQVRYMGPTWRWAWEYAIGNRKLCWLHIMQNGLDVTFTLSEGDESRLTKSSKVATVIARALVEGQRTGPVKWCWLELSDRRAIDAFSVWPVARRNGWPNAPRLGGHRGCTAEKLPIRAKPTETVGLGQGRVVQ